MTVYSGIGYTSGRRPRKDGVRDRGVDWTRIGHDRGWNESISGKSVECGQCWEWAGIG